MGVTRQMLSVRRTQKLLWISWCLYQNPHKKYPSETVSQNHRERKGLRNADCPFAKGLVGLLNQPRGRDTFRKLSSWPFGKRTVW